MTEVVVRNAARCKKCGDEIESKHRHDMVWCGCKSIFVDGGKDYCRAGGDLEHFESLARTVTVHPAMEPTTTCHECGEEQPMSDPPVCDCGAGLVLPPTYDELLEAAEYFHTTAEECMEPDDFAKAVDVLKRARKCKEKVNE